jgi:hypothetical protein
MSLDIRPNPSATGSVTGGLSYKGSYNATTNSPNLTSSLKGDFYIVSVGGTLAGVTLDVGDHIVFNQDASSPITSAMFDKIDNTDAVASVNTQTGVVVLDTDDISEGGSNLYYTNTRADGRISAANLTDLNDVNYTAGAGIDGQFLKYVNANSRWEAAEAPSAPVSSVNTQTGAVVLDTDDISEGSNLYYTNARADARIGAANLTDLNDVNYTAGAGIDGKFLKYVNANSRWEAADAPADAVSSVNTQTGAVVLDTDDISEATNLYYTNARADARIGAANLTDLNDVNYTAGAGIDGQVLTYVNANNRWEAAAVPSAPVSSVNTQTGAVVLDTDDISEATNLYYTNARADARIGAANLTDLNDVNYTAGAGIDGYVLEYVHANNRWEAKVASGGGSAPDVVTDSSGTNTTISTTTGIEEVHLINNGSNAVTITLPSASTAGEGYKYQIKRLGTATVTVDPNGTEQIDNGGAGVAITLDAQFESVTIVSDNSNWFII